MSKRNHSDAMHAMSYLPTLRNPSWRRTLFGHHLIRNLSEIVLGAIVLFVMLSLTYNVSRIADALDRAHPVAKQEQSK